MKWILRTLVVYICCLICNALSYASLVYEDGAVLLENTSWSSGEDIEIRGVLTVDVDATLSIAPGVTVYWSAPLASQSCEIVVAGNIVAIGTSLDPIRFEPLNGFAAESVFGISLPRRNGGRSLTEFRHCRFIDGLMGIVVFASPGETIRIRDCYFTDVENALSVASSIGAQISIHRCHFENSDPQQSVRSICLFGTPLSQGSTDKVDVSNCVFKSVSDISIAIEVTGAIPDCRITHCYFEAYAKAVQLGRITPSSICPRIYNCIFEHNLLAINGCANTRDYQSRVVANAMFDNNKNFDDRIGNSIVGNQLQVHLPLSDCYYHLNADVNQPLSRYDGINDGFQNGAAALDPDGSLPDIGVHGGPVALPDSNYVILPSIESLPVTINAGTIERATYRVRGIYQTQLNTRTNLSPGSVFLFDPDAYLACTAATSSLWIQGSSELPIVLSGFHGAQWPGIYVAEKCAMHLENATIRQAYIGVVRKNGKVEMDAGACIRDCKTGIWMEGTDRGQRDVITAGIIENCKTGIAAVTAPLVISANPTNPFIIRNCSTGIEALGASVNLRNIAVEDCYSGGVRLNLNCGALLDQCQILRNGSGKIFEGGILVCGNSTVRLKCLQLRNNRGPGIDCSDGMVIMEDASGNGAAGGNDISDNYGIAQIHLKNKSLLKMENGRNRIFNQLQPFSSTIFNQSSNTVNPSGNYWNSASYSDIVGRLRPSTGFDLVNFAFDAAWTPCTPAVPTLPAGNCALQWNVAANRLGNALELAAIDELKRLVIWYPSCEAARVAPGMIYALNKQVLWDSSGGALIEPDSGAVRDTLAWIANELAATPVEKVLETSAAMADIRDGAYEHATIELSELAQSATAMDSITVAGALCTAAYCDSMASDSGLQQKCRHADSLITTVTRIQTLASDSLSLVPLLVHVPSEPLTASDYVYDVTADAWTGDQWKIDYVLIEYRLLPAGGWQQQTLVATPDIADSSYQVLIDLPEYGGALEYRLICIDQIGRIQTWPMQAGFPDLSDTLSHFVSFEPRVEYVESDTVYMYAPGRITHPISVVGDSAAIIIAPLPNDSDAVILVDANLDMFNFEGALTDSIPPQLIIEGTQSTPILITSADSSEMWNGFSFNGGYARWRNVIIERAVSPLLFFGANNCAVQLDSCVFRACYPIELNEATNSGPDSSFLRHVKVLTAAKSGIIINAGCPVLENLEVAGSQAEGIEFQYVSDGRLEKSYIHDNASMGLLSGSEDVSCLRIENCVIERNGGEAPEISAGKYCHLKMDSGAHNVIRDQSGVLVSVNDLAELYLEYGDNVICLTDSSTTGPYIQYETAEMPGYLTGNSFSPVGISDSIFTSSYLQDNPSGWVWAELRLENLTAEVIVSPADTIELTVQTFIDNALDAAPSDSICEIGLKYRMAPDTIWSINRQFSAPADSIVRFSLPIGDLGGLVEFVFWSRDTHGRFLTSPVNADTADPSAGTTHFVSYEMNITEVRDSLTLWAPFTLSHNLWIKANGYVEVKPWPGATNHDVMIAPNVEIILERDQYLRVPELVIMGTEEEPIRLMSQSDSLGWSGISVASGKFKASYTTMTDISNYIYTGYMGAYPLQWDHCMFTDMVGGIYLDNPVPDSSYMRQCVFQNVGQVLNASIMILGGGIEITDCWFANSESYGLWTYATDNTTISGSKFTNNDLGGLYTDGWSSGVDILCSEFSYNGADSTAEVIVDAGSFNFADGSSCTFADVGGTLLEATDLASFMLGSGENNFYLLDSTGLYVSSQDTIGALNLSGNYFWPIGPDTSAFFTHLNPTGASHWTADSFLTEPSVCGMAGTLTQPGVDPFIMENEDVSAMMVFAMPQQMNRKSSPADSPTFAKRQTAPVLANAISHQKSKNYAWAADGFAAFLNDNPGDPQAAGALSRHFACSKKAGRTTGLSQYYAVQEERLMTGTARKAAHDLRLTAQAREGDPQSAINGYEALLQQALTENDSVHAMIALMELHLRFGKIFPLQAMYPEHRVKDIRDFAERVIRLTSDLHRHQSTLNDAAAESVVPSNYQLYQNYPNPFNPTTEIRFDLPENVQVELKIYNVLGQEVATLLDEIRPAGAYTMHWDSRTASGLSVASGVYVYRLKAGNFVDAKKMTLIR